jgi:hypothetical protein
MGKAEKFFGQSSATGRIGYAHGGGPRVEPFCRVAQGGALRHGGTGATGELGFAWSAEYPVAGRRNDLWVLVCGGIAAAAAFAAAFVASGGVASHPAAPGAAVPAAVSQACPSPTPGTGP